jgi:sirohydrochlorin cobaltochelatase
MTQGLILFAHGARDPRWAQPFEAVAAQVRAARPDTAVRLAFLELMAPDLPSVGTELAAAGCKQVQILPLFLGAGGHVRRDLPALVDGLRAAHPGTTFTLHHAAGESEHVIAALAAAGLAALDHPAAP